jgi:hypothetical protein
MNLSLRIFVMGMSLATGIPAQAAFSEAFTRFNNNAYKVDPFLKK